MAAGAGALKYGALRDLVQGLGSGKEAWQGVFKDALDRDWLDYRARQGASLTPGEMLPEAQQGSLAARGAAEPGGFPPVAAPPGQGIGAPQIGEAGPQLANAPRVPSDWTPPQPGESGLTFTGTTLRPGEKAVSPTPVLKPNLPSQDEVAQSLAGKSYAKLNEAQRASVDQVIDRIGNSGFTPPPPGESGISAPPPAGFVPQVAGPSAPSARQVPFYDRMSTLDPAQAKNIKVGAIRVNPDASFQELREVPLSNVAAITEKPQNIPQDVWEAKGGINTIYPETVQKYVSNPSAVSPELIQTGPNKFEVWDGNHRVEAARQRGDQTINAWVPTTRNSPAIPESGLAEAARTPQPAATVKTPGGEMTPTQWQSVAEVANPDKLPLSHMANRLLAASRAVRELQAKGVTAEDFASALQADEAAMRKNTGWDNPTFGLILQGLHYNGGTR